MTAIGQAQAFTHFWFKLQLPRLLAEDSPVGPLGGSPKGGAQRLGRAWGRVLPDSISQLLDPVSCKERGCPEVLSGAAPACGIKTLRGTLVKARPYITGVLQ